MSLEGRPTGAEVAGSRGGPGQGPAVAGSPVLRYAMARDASHYHLVPSAVERVAGVGDVAGLFARCRRSGSYLTFRSGGTSLSGQGVTDGILVDVRHGFQSAEVLDGGHRLRAEPGVTVRAANARLRPYGRKLGPDPASEVACTLGGVIANNSSGMACGTGQNAYQTLEAMTVVLPSGSVIDTGAPDADERLRALEPDLYAGLLRLRERICRNPASVATLRRQFSMKNTMGYSLNSFLDYERPVEILAHLMVGSEGTLGFVASATFRTVELFPHASTGLAVFRDLATATAALPELVDVGFATIELMDARSLAVAQTLGATPAEIGSLEVRDHVALLVELQAATTEELADKVSGAGGVCDGLEIESPLELTSDPWRRKDLWHVRKGLYTAVAGARQAGTTALLEDVAVPVPHLRAACQELTKLFDAHGYQNSVIFGHAKDGNIHFMLTETFRDPARLERYHAFTEKMVELVLEHKGTLKAEHGTGRIMAGYVRRQYGDELYDVMTEVKRLFDPLGILNPGVVLSDDPRSYLRNLKDVPTVGYGADMCVECGYCEPVCPSRTLTLTPRQRIALLREREAARREGDEGLADELSAAYRYDVVDTCAVDGMCQTACPVQINTGSLVRELRAERVNKAEDALWRSAARHWGATTTLAGKALSAAAALPPTLPTAAASLARRTLGTDRMPQYDASLPRGGYRRRAVAAAAEACTVYFPACVGAMFGSSSSSGGVMPAMLTLCARAGVAVRVPRGIASMCCGMPWKSKGLRGGHEVIGAKVLPALLAATDGGRLPVVCDAASCTEGLEELRAEAKRLGGAYEALRFVDALEFVRAEVVGRLSVTRRVASLVLHPTCSTERRGTTTLLRELAELVSDEVVVPLDWNCCAFAGDRGLLHPELTAAATLNEAREVNSRAFEVHASANRTCEIGMSRATGREYVHIVEALEYATRPIRDSAHPGGAG
ncbi:FAD/FMN-dependent dehydrogenase [Frankia sp. BMG5.23]|nr:FAD/FMN-dependent dehydrogenase [Frankia sp. BMG5.23]